MLLTMSYACCDDAQDGSSGEHIVKIGDLGVAKLMSTSTAFANTVVGTPYNLSPELCQDQVSSSATIVDTCIAL